MVENPDSCLLLTNENRPVSYYRFLKGDGFVRYTEREDDNFYEVTRSIPLKKLVELANIVT